MISKSCHPARSKILRLAPLTFILTALVLVFVSSSLPAQQTPNQSQPPQVPTDVLASTTFQSRTDLVLVPVVVRDKQGKHIPGLAKDAFHLEENGKDQIISLFEEVQPSAVEPSPSRVTEGAYSNLPFDNARQLRLTIIVLDLLNTAPLQRTDGKDQLLKFLSKGLAQNQPVSLLCLTGQGLQLVHPFSTDTSVLIEALKKFPPGGERIIPRKEAARETLKQLRQIAQAYTGIPGRKTMIFAAGNIPDPQIESAVYDNSFSALDSFQQTWNDLINANIAVYPIQLMAWAVNPGSRSIRPPSAEATLREFADATGGNRCLESNGMTSCLAEAVEDSRSYYMLGFTVRPDDRKPGWRNLQVKLSIDHANIRARNGFYYGSPEPAGSPAAAHDTEINALTSPLAYSAVPMYVRVLPPAPAPPSGRDPSLQGKKTTVEFLVTIPLTSIKVDASNPYPLDLEIGAIALTRDIRDAGEFLHPVRGNPTPETLQQFAREGIKLHEKLDLLPGTYDVRVMARDNNAAQIGTVVFPLEVK